MLRAMELQTQLEEKLLQKKITENIELNEKIRVLEASHSYIEWMIYAAENGIEARKLFIELGQLKILHDKIKAEAKEQVFKLS